MLFNKVKTESTTNKTFSYKKGSVNLSFTLNIENKRELKDFLDLLKVAQESIKKEIN